MLTSVMISHDMQSLTRMTVSLDQLSEEEIQTLLKELEPLPAIHPEVKSMAIQVLYGFGIKDLEDVKEGEDFQQAVEWALDSPMDPSDVASLIGKWAAQDLDEALEWYQQSRAEGKFSDKGLTNLPEFYFGAALAGPVFERSSEDGMKFLNESDPTAQPNIIKEALGVLVSQGEESWPLAQELFGRLTERYRRQAALKDIAGVLYQGQDREKTGAFLNQLELRDGELSYSFGAALAYYGEDDPVGERMDWVLRNVSREMANAVVNEAVNMLYPREENEVSEWIEGLGNSSLRDEALAAESWALMMALRDEEAIEKADLIGDSDAKEKALLEIRKQQALWKKSPGSHFESDEK